MLPYPGRYDVTRRARFSFGLSPTSLRVNRAGSTMCRPLRSSPKNRHHQTGLTDLSRTKNAVASHLPTFQSSSPRSFTVSYSGPRANALPKRSSRPTYMNALVGKRSPLASDKIASISLRS